VSDYTPNTADLRAWTTFDPASQQKLLSGGTVTGGDGRQFVLIDGHATVVGSGSYQAGMAARQSASTPIPTPAPAAAPAPPAPAQPPTAAEPQYPAAPVFSPSPGKGAWMDLGSGAYSTGHTTLPDGSQQAGNQTGAPAAVGADGMTSDERNAYQTLLGMFRQYGLESLAPTILNLIKQGYDPTSISYMLQQSPEYKARFAGNDGRVKNGLAPLSPAEYLATERAYRQALSSAGIPQSYYDNHADFTQYIAGDVSPAEIKTRADEAMQFVNESDPTYLNAFRTYYGAQTPGDVAAFFLDGAKNVGVLATQAQAARIGAAALQQGLAAPGRQQAEIYAGQGVTDSQAQQGFQNVAAVLPDETKIASRFHQQYTQQDAQDEFLGGLASAQRKRRQLNNSEEALFSGSSGLNQNSLKINTAGSY
jgi:hypothetical protein